MIKLRIQELLDAQGKSRYWLSQQLDGMCYRKLKNLLDNEVISIRFSTLEKLTKILNVPVGELFEEIPDEPTNE